MLFVIHITILFFSLMDAQAAIRPSGSRQNSFEIPFYKSSSSLFPSGYTTVDNLKKQLVSNEMDSSKYYRWNKLFFRQDELKPIFATHLSRYVVDSTYKNRYKVLDTTINNLQLFDETTRQQLKKNIQDVRADAYDIGYVMTLKDTYLRSTPTENAKIKTTIPQGNRLIVEKYLKKHAFVRYQNYEGYIDVSELITKFDFASFVFAKDTWHQVAKRDFDEIITLKNQRIRLNDIQGVITPQSSGIIASNSQKIPLWSRVELMQSNLSVWSKSKLKDHGIVWWKPFRENEQIFYDIDELLKKDISSVSFHPSNPMKGLLSSDGVYITENGQLWRKLQQFENFNGPVHYVNDLLLFVGNFRSVDGGKTFDNFIQIDKLASAIEFQYGFTPKKLQVRKIESPEPFKLRIEIDTGVRKIKMMSPIFLQDWKATKS